MVGTTLDFDTVQDDRDNIAKVVSNFFDTWNNQRQGWISEVKEIRNYVFATDTTTTTNKTLPWKNSTTVPKLCQIRDNLHAYYMAALFPSSNWLTWEGLDEDGEAKDKKEVITSYMDNKLKQVKFRKIVSNLIYDYIDYGNVFCTAKWEVDTTTDSITGETIPVYIGAKPVRISPFDIVFDPTAAEFKDSPKIIRSIMSIGELKSKVEQDIVTEEDQAMYDYAVGKSIDHRKNYSLDTTSNKEKIEAFQIDGFGSLQEYYNSGMIEVLQFVGTLYDINSDELLENKVITIVDRSYVINVKDNPSWLKENVIHVGWRSRPDNLYAMSPLANLVGMQYRIDHLENLKADVFDMIAFPMLKIQGTVDDFDYAPNERIYTGEEGDVNFMSPDVTALNADTQIAILEQKMEEMAGAPKQAMGFRTAGEKTAYEVQVLENNSSRVFLNKTAYFEENLLEPLINMMLELSRRNMSESDLIRTLDTDTDVVTFTKVTKEDLKSSGKFRPLGATNFARKANLVQNLTQLFSSAIGQDPSVNVHISGIKTAKIIEEALDFEKFGIVEENVRVREQTETQRQMQAASEQLEIEAATPAGINAAEQEGLV